MASSAVRRKGQQEALPGQKKSLSIAFTHKELVIGGAEKLILLTATGLQKFGHSVEIFTTYHDPKNCLPLSKDESFIELQMFLLPAPRVKVVSTPLNVGVFDRHFDVIINDQVASVNPFLRYFCKKLVFYCHFPDALLSNRNTTSSFYKFYRFVLDALEKKTMGLELSVEILYPPVDIQKLQILRQRVEKTSISDLKAIQPWMVQTNFFFSLNRFERKKNIKLAIEAFHQSIQVSSEPLNLIIAGGLDTTNKECVAYLSELKAFASSIIEKEDSSSIYFLTSINEEDYAFLLTKCVGLLYTPENEHFGMIPCEAMASGCLVIASNSGGPKETILHEETGYLCEHTADSFSEAMISLLNLQKKDVKTLEAMKKKAIQRSAAFNLGNSSFFF
ncbi:glycosyltransferase, group 1 family protein [Cardiosporidium cionae]|uniref:Alpha-1,3/1,6-mannosyltransferase ALG2 n=1 Tax=Cardiosporidium cionae TaxID=476202 RepID=A0ABQ7J796_9APIC|nr:glycosyltransferase, group 1 family protein [Cardiosporidium cionae]|eukprot:KAF8819872.1 glycosyltransferase, group 1 family protein [Cardiosporidium cionae]